MLQMKCYLVIYLTYGGTKIFSLQNFNAIYLKENEVRWNKVRNAYFTLQMNLNLINMYFKIIELYFL